MAEGIFFLDAGRKFFSVTSVETLMDAAKAAGLQAMILYFSDNQGFRFGLTDSVVTTAFGRYDLTPTLGDGYCQEDKAPDGSGKFWSEADMERLLRRSRELGLELIPALNMPGHLGCILEHFPHFRYPGSRSSIDLRSDEATAFALGILEKYARWFAARGCTRFCLGADEFANDLGQMGLDVIYHTGDMRHFVTFVNRAAELLAGLGLTPMAFNDGICYHDDPETFGMVDKRVTVLYWIAGWNGYYPASPTTLAKLGYRLINCCHKFYCGAGCPDWQEKAALMQTFRYPCFDRDILVPEAAGGMLCCWCDRANFYGMDDGKALAELLPPVIAAFGNAMGRT